MDGERPEMIMGGRRNPAYGEEEGFSSPWVALSLLRGRIAEGLATRYLIREEGVRRLGHDRAVGHVGCGCVVVDGEEISFEELTDLLQSYEGWGFELRIQDPFRLE